MKTGPSAHSSICFVAAVALLLAGGAAAAVPLAEASPPEIERPESELPKTGPPEAEPAAVPAPPPGSQPPAAPAEAVPVAPKPATPLGPPTPAQSASAEGETWADDSHRSLEQDLSDLTDYLDGIFGEGRRLDLERPGSYLRWRNELRLDDRWKWTPRTSVRAGLQLPNFTRWLKGLQLAFAGESKGDPTARRLEDPGNPGFSPSIRAEQANLELRLDLLRRPSTTVLQVASGVRLRWPFETFAAARFRLRLELGWKVVSRLTQEGIWTSRERFGEKTQLDLDRPIGAYTQLRWNNAGFITGVSRGYEWATEVGVAHELVRLRTATYLGFAVSGFGLPKAEVELYRLFTRVRRDVWRRWLFLELEPEIGWPTAPGLGRHQVLAVTMRVDIILDSRAPPAKPGGPKPGPVPVPPGG